MNILKQTHSFPFPFPFLVVLFCAGGFWALLFFLFPPLGPPGVLILINSIAVGDAIGYLHDIVQNEFVNGGGPSRLYIIKSRE